ncbi:hypothetical protein NPN14_25350, partial [Vibrio parahaemolyticus]|uniref:hypothetical protein n=1 Tax=Vibrio parahaemolyticus TaxID=670 RepID=UPI002111B19A
QLTHLNRDEVLPATNGHGVAITPSNEAGITPPALGIQLTSTPLNAWGDVELYQLHQLANPA